MAIWVYVDYKENITIIREKERTNVLMTKNVLSKKETHISKLIINVY